MKFKSVLLTWRILLTLLTSRPRKLVSSQQTRLADSVRPTRRCPPYFLPPMIRNNFVPQSGHTPWMAGRPFFIVTSCALAISFFPLHFTQYASATGFASTPIRVSFETIYRILLAAANKRQGAKRQGSVLIWFLEGPAELSAGSAWPSNFGRRPTAEDGGPFGPTQGRRRPPLQHGHDTFGGLSAGSAWLSRECGRAGRYGRAAPM